MVVEVHQAFVNAIKDTGVFKEVVVGYIPPPSKIKRHPSVSMDFAKFSKERINTGTCHFAVEEIVDIYLYAKAPKSNKYSDVIPPLTLAVDTAITTDTILNNILVDGYVTEVISDGGITYPEVVAKVAVKLIYRITQQ